MIKLTKKQINYPVIKTIKISITLRLIKKKRSATLRSASVASTKETTESTALLIGTLTSYGVFMKRGGPLSRRMVIVTVTRVVLCTFGCLLSCAPTSN